MTAKCSRCGSELTTGFVVSTNGSGLLWAKESAEIRARPRGLEVLAPTGFTGMFSASLPGHRCTNCGLIALESKPSTPP